MWHIGGLPYLAKRAGISYSAVYATLPVHNLGQISLLEALSSHADYGRKEDLPFTAKEVTETFEEIIHLRFQEHASLGGNAAGISVTPYTAGNSVGAALWRIRKNTEDILYSVGYNHKRERCLDGASLDSFSRPSLLITDVKQALSVHVNRKQRDADLIDSVMSCLRSSGNVLIPVDSTTRMLEMAFILEEQWSMMRLPYKIAILTQQAEVIMEYAKSMLEWMGDSIVKSFSSNRENPFDFKYVKLCRSISEIEAMSDPKVVLANYASLDLGYSRSLFAIWSEVPQNLVVFTTKGYKDCLSRKLIESDNIKQVTIEIYEKLPLQGAELKKYYREKQEKKDELAAERALVAYMKKREDVEMESDDEEADQIEDNLSNAKLLKDMFWADCSTDLVIEEEECAHEKFDVEPLKPIYRMYPAVEKRTRFDEYGEIVRAEDFVNQALVKEKEADLARSKLHQDSLKSKLESEPEVQTHPTKLVSYPKEVSISCKRKFIDFEGLSDGRSIKTIVSKIAPRKLILIGGNQECTEYFIRYCKFSSSEFTKQVLAPHSGECVNVSSSTDIQQVQISDVLLNSLSVKQLGEYELAFLVGSFDSASNGLLLKPLDSNTTVRHDPILIGDVRLSEFKKVLQENGLSVQFQDGDLICNQLVSIRKLDSGELVLEGPLCEDYYHIRSLMYEQLAVL